MDDDAALAHQDELDREHWNMEQTNEIAAALAKAQAEMRNPGFDRTNPHFRNKYATLAAVRDAVIPVLAKHGIACVQDLRTADGYVTCTTTLMHASGQLTFGPLAIPASKMDAQGFGSAATYARRYSLMAVANVVGDDDDDANAATGKPASGEHIHDPRDGLPPADPVRVSAAVETIRRAWTRDTDEDGVAIAVFDAHESLRSDQSVYVAAIDEYAKSTPKLKSGWKELVKRGRELANQIPTANGRAA